MSASRPYFVIEWSGGGGLGHYAFLLADALAGAGEDVYLLTREGFELSGASHRQTVLCLWPKAPVDVVRWRRRLRVGAGRLVGWLRAARTVSRKRRSHPIVHLQSVDLPLEMAFAGLFRLLGATVVVTVHNARPHEGRRLSSARQRLGLRAATGLIAHTTATATALRRLRGPRVPLRVVAHPSYARLVQEGATSSTRPTGPLRVAVLGMLRPYKGLEFVVAAFNEVRSRTTLHCELRVAGRADDAEWVRKATSSVPPSAVSLHLDYLPLPALINEVLRADVLFLGHRSTSASGIAQLGLGAGVPVLGPEVGAVGDLLATQPEWLYHPGDVRGAAARLEALLTQLSRDRHCMRASAASLAGRSPSWTAMAAACLEVAQAPRAPSRHPG